MSTGPVPHCGPVPATMEAARKFLRRYTDSHIQLRGGDDDGTDQLRVVAKGSRNGLALKIQATADLPVSKPEEWTELFMRTARYVHGEIVMFDPY